MTTSDVRVTARIRRTEDGQTHHEYVVNGIGYGSIAALESALSN